MHRWRTPPGCCGVGVLSGHVQGQECTRHPGACGALTDLQGAMQGEWVPAECLSMPWSWHGGRQRMSRGCQMESEDERKEGVRDRRGDEMKKEGGEAIP